VRNKDLIPTHEGSSGEIRKDPERSEQGPHHVNRETGMSVKQRLHTHPRIRLQALKNLCLLLCFNVKGVDPKILEKLQVLDVQGMIFGRTTHPIGEAHLRGCNFPRRTLPPAWCLALITVRLADSEFVERGFGFPFFKSSGRTSQRQEIWGMPW